MLKTILTATAAAALITAPAAALDHHKEDKMAKSEKSASYGKGQTIAGKAMKTDALSTLVAAAKAGDLVGALNGDGPLTVFAPTNAAFGDIQDTVDVLLMPENKDQLQRVLKAHVVAADLSAADLVLLAKANDGQIKLDTISGDTLTVKLMGGTLMIVDESGNEAGVVTADVDAKNGIVHVVDTVLVPQV